MATFKLLRRDGSSESIKYAPLVVVAGTEVHKLALHKDNVGNWVDGHNWYDFAFAYDPFWERT